MQIIKLPVGEQAPVDTDCIRVEEQPGPSFRLTASALCTGSDDGDSVSIVESTLFDTFEQAEAAGMAWAEDVGVTHLHVVTGTLDQPLEVIEIDKPL